MNEIPSAEDWLKEHCKDEDWNNLGEDLNDTFWTSNAIKYMQEFANMHVQAALLKASQNADVDIKIISNELEDYNPTEGIDYEIYVINSSIIEAYPLQNIK